MPYSPSWRMKTIYSSDLDSEISEISYDTAPPSSSDLDIEMPASSDSNIIICNQSDTVAYKSSNDDDDGQNQHVSSDSGNHSCTLCNVLIIAILFTCMFMRVLCICTFIYK